MPYDLFSFSTDGFLVMSIDNLSAQVPREATDHFGDQLRHFLTPLVSGQPLSLLLNIVFVIVAIPVVVSEAF